MNKGSDDVSVDDDDAHMEKRIKRVYRKVAKNCNTSSQIRNRNILQNKRHVARVLEKTHKTHRTHLSLIVRNSPRDTFKTTAKTG